MKTYRITTYNNKATYTVSIDETGVVKADGLTGLALGSLKTTVTRYMTKHGFSAETALGLAVGPYSTVDVENDGAVSDQEPASGVS